VHERQPSPIRWERATNAFFGVGRVRAAVGRIVGRPLRSVRPAVSWVVTRPALLGDGRCWPVATG